MKIGKIGARRYLGTAAAATLICLLSALCSGASSTLGGIVLTGGALTLDFADPANNHSPNVIDRLDVMTWSGGSGALAGQNLVFAGPPQSTDECTEPVSSFGQISLLYPGELAAFANRTALTMTSITTGGNCSYFSPPNPAYSTTTVYTTFPAGDPDVNEFQLVRTFPAYNTADFEGTLAPFYPPYMGYVPAVSSALFGTVLYPNTAGTITTAQACDAYTDALFVLTAGCVETDWNGTWFADDNGSGSGIVIFRDASSTAPAVLNVFFPPPVNNLFFGNNANQNLTMIALRPVADAQGAVASFTETEWVCVYDPTTWPAAARAAGTLPTGCAQHAPTTALSPQFSFTPVLYVTPEAVITSNAVHVNVGTSAISITGGSYSINGAPYTTAAGVVGGNADITVQVTASGSQDIASGLGLASAVLTIGGVSSEFLVVSTFGPSVTLQVNPTTITLGQQATLNWLSQEVLDCMAGGAWSGPQNATGTQTVTPTTTGTFTYSLTCTASPPSVLTVHAAKTHKATRNHTNDPTSHDHQFGDLDRQRSGTQPGTDRDARRQSHLGDRGYCVNLDLVIDERNRLHSERRMDRCRGDVRHIDTDAYKRRRRYLYFDVHRDWR